MKYIKNVETLEELKKAYKKYGYMLILVIVIVILLSINFLYKQMDSKLTSIEIKDNEIKIMYNTYKPDEIVEVI